MSKNLDFPSLKTTLIMLMQHRHSTNNFVLLKYHEITLHMYIRDLIYSETTRECPFASNLFTKSLYIMNIGVYDKEINLRDTLLIEMIIANFK